MGISMDAVKKVEVTKYGGYGVVFLFLAFMGEPDLWDAIISWIMRQP